MGDIDINAMADQMAAAAREVLGEKWPEAKNFAVSESEKFARNMAEIAQWKLDGTITEEQAEALARMHQRSMKMVLTAIEGIGLAMAEKAVNAAIDVIRGAVNRAIGWNIL